MPSVEKIRPNDNVILILGPTGAGKSQFITSAIQDPSIDIVGASLSSHTQKVTPYRMSKKPGKELYDDSIVLVDSPGFDDTNRADQHTLSVISQWLAKLQREKILLAGVLWFHPINTPRMNNTAVDNLNMFLQICGVDVAKTVVYVTTMWDVPEAGQLHEDNLKQLEKEFWQEMLQNGAKSARFDLRDEVSSAWSIIRPLASQQNTRKALRLQEELARSPHIQETSAFRTLLDEFGRLTQDYRRANENLQSLLIRHRRNLQHPDLLAAQTQVSALRDKLDRAIQETKQKKPFKRKWFGFVKSDEEKRFEELSQAF